MRPDGLTLRLITTTPLFWFLQGTSFLWHHEVTFWFTFKFYYVLSWIELKQLVENAQNLLISASPEWAFGCFSLLDITVSWISLRFGLLVGQNKTSKDITLNGYFLIFYRQKMNWLIRKIIGRLLHIITSARYSKKEVLFVILTHDQVQVQKDKKEPGVLWCEQEGQPS